MEVFRPGAIVLQMGADSLSGDKLGGFNLTLQGELLASVRVWVLGVSVVLVGLGWAMTGGLCSMLEQYGEVGGCREWGHHGLSCRFGGIGIGDSLRLGDWETGVHG